MTGRHRDIIEGQYRVAGDARTPLPPEPAVNAEAAGGFVALALLVAAARCAFLFIG